MAEKTFNIPAFLAQTPQPVAAPVTLSGTRYLLRLYWGPAVGWGAGAWLLDLSAADGEPLAPTVPLVLSSDLWAEYKTRDPRVPQGNLEVRRLTGSGDPGPSDLGVAVELVYVD